MRYTAVIEQTKHDARRVRYDPVNGTFQETADASLFYARFFPYPYGWIRESGTPPQPHWDVIVMTDDECGRGETVPIRVIGVFRRNDGDHKMIAVKAGREAADLSDLTQAERDALKRLYPRTAVGEGFFGAEEAKRILTCCEKPL